MSQNFLGDGDVEETLPHWLQRNEPVISYSLFHMDLKPSNSKSFREISHGLYMDH